MITCTVGTFVIRVCRLGVDPVHASSPLISGPSAVYHIHTDCPVACYFGFLQDTLLGLVCTLVWYFEQYGSSEESFFKCPGCLHQKHILSLGAIFFMPCSPFDLGIFFSGVLGTAFSCASVAGMKDLAAGLKPCLNGDGCLCCPMG